MTPVPESTAPALLIVPILGGIAFFVLQIQSRRRKARRRTQQP
jgi:preprotein translocase subunit YajC